MKKLLITCLLMLLYLPAASAENTFALPDGMAFGDSITNVTIKEYMLGNSDGDLFEPGDWFSSLVGYLKYHQSLTYYNVNYLGVDYTAKGYHFNKAGELFAVFHEFRSGYHLELSGQAVLSNFAPAYASVQAYLTGQYGEPHFSYAKHSRCSVLGHGMREFDFILDSSQNIYDYCEWLFNTPQGTVKVEHVMYFTGVIYTHNVCYELIN